MTLQALRRFLKSRASNPLPEPQPPAWTILPGAMKALGIGHNDAPPLDDDCDQFEPPVWRQLNDAPKVPNSTLIAQHFTVSACLSSGHLSQLAPVRHKPP